MAGSCPALKGQRSLGNRPAAAENSPLRAFAPLREIIFSSPRARPGVPIVTVAERDPGSSPG